MTSKKTTGIIFSRDFAPWPPPQSFGKKLFSKKMDEQLEELKILVYRGLDMQAYWTVRDLCNWVGMCGIKISYGSMERFLNIELSNSDSLRKTSVYHDNGRHKFIKNYYYRYYREPLPEVLEKVRTPNQEPILFEIYMDEMRRVNEFLVARVYELSETVDRLAQKLDRE